MNINIDLASINMHKIRIDAMFISCAVSMSNMLNMNNNMSILLYIIILYIIYKYIILSVFVFVIFRLLLIYLNRIRVHILHRTLTLSYVFPVPNLC